MSRTSYDDWNVTDSVFDENITGSVSFNARANSNIMLFSVTILLVIGLISVFSATYSQALSIGKASYSFLLTQFLFVGLGFIVSILVMFASNKLVRIVCPVLMLGSLILFCSNVFVGNQYLLTETSINFVFTVYVMYLSLFFANRTEGINRLRELIIPTIFAVLFLIAVLMQKTFALGLIFILLTIVMFAAGGVGAGGVILLICYAVVPIVCWIISDADNLRKLLNILIPGYFSDIASSLVSTAKAAIASGGLVGKGLGNGTYKLGVLQGIDSDFIFCNIAEEFGFVGCSVVFLLFILLTWTGYRSARHLRVKNRFYSNFSVGLTTILAFQFILNITSVLGILPVGGFSLPLISFGDNIVISIVQCAMLYKMSRENEDGYEFDEVRVNSSNSDFEVQYENQNS